MFKCSVQVFCVMIVSLKNDNVWQSMGQLAILEVSLFLLLLCTGIYSNCWPCNLSSCSLTSGGQQDSFHGQKMMVSVGNNLL